MRKTCIIIEDQPPAQRILQKFITDMGTLTLKNTFSNAFEALSFLQENAVDIIFLDIHLPKISGIDFLKTLNHSPQVILTTAFSEYALESYDYNVTDYLLKPFSFQRFVQAVTKCMEKPIVTPTEKKEDFFIKSGYDLLKVNTADILYITSDADYTKIITNQKTYISSESLKIWLIKLDNSIFCQIHKSYILNTTYLQKISGNLVYLITEQTLPIGRAYKENFLNRVVRGSF